MQVTIAKQPPFHSNPGAAAPANAARQKPGPVSLRGAWTLPIIAFVGYLFVIHSFKLNAAQEVLVVGLISVVLFSRPLRVSPAMLWYGAFLAWSLVTLPVSPILSESWDMWYAAFKVWLIMFLVYNAVRTEGQTRLVTLAWLAMFALYPVRGTLFNFAGGFSHFGRYSWNFTFSNFNDLAAITLMPLALAVDRLRSRETKWIRLCAIAGMVSMPFIILITQSRGGMLGLAAFIAFMVARSRQRIRMIIALVVVSLGAVLFAPQSVWDRIVGMKALRSTETLNTEADGSAQQRWMIMHIAAQIAAQHPVVGVGTGAYHYMHGQFTSGRAEYELASGQRDSHNTYLRIAAENGVIGLVLFLMVFGSTYNELRKTAKQARKRNSPEDKELADRCQVYQAALIGLAVCAVFGSLNALSFPFIFVTLANASVRVPRTAGLSASTVRSAAVSSAQPMTRRFRGGWRPISVPNSATN